MDNPASGDGIFPYGTGSEDGSAGIRIRALCGIDGGDGMGRVESRTGIFVGLCREHALWHDGGSEYRIRRGRAVSVI